MAVKERRLSRTLSQNGDSQENPVHDIKMHR
jgi:hypothetical protein